MKKIIFIALAIIANYSIKAQTITFNGGFKPNNLKGTHFGSNIAIPLKKRTSFSVNYNLVKYTDIFPQTSFQGISLHKEYKQDETLIPYKEFERGIPIQRNEIDFRPRDLYHSFGFLFGYRFLDNKNFFLALHAGPHFSLNRTYYQSFGVDPAKITLTENSQAIAISYFDYNIYRDWDIGPTIRADTRYKLFQNMALGLFSSISMDVISEGIDLCVGGSISYDFGWKSK